MIRHAANNKISTRHALSIISRFGIPKNKRRDVISLMYDRELLKKINRDEIKIINPEKSENMDRNVYDIVWGIVLEGEI